MSSPAPELLAPRRGAKAFEFKETFNPSLEKRGSTIVIAGGALSSPAPELLAPRRGAKAFEFKGGLFKQEGVRP